MNKEELIEEGKKLSHWERHKFMVLVVLAILASLAMVVISMELYNSSGTAQLDLSRPGYQSVRAKVQEQTGFPTFPGTGPIDQKTLSDFEKTYDEQAKKVTSVDSFGGTVMSDQALSIDAPAQ